MNASRKIIAIGDVHGLDSWKNIIEKHNDCHIVFLGDYCDPYNPRQSPAEVVDNLKEIITYKQENEARVTLLLGNHDVHYFDKRAAIGSRYNSRIAGEVRELFVNNRELFICAYEEENLLFTHAGVSQGWYIEEFSTIIDHVADRLNHPEQYGCDASALYYCGYMRGGSHKHGGIYWADDTELSVPLEGYIHIVGHNRKSDITVHASYIESGESGIIFCDSLFNGNYLIIESDKCGNTHYYAANIGHDELRELDSILQKDSQS